MQTKKFMSQCRNSKKVHKMKKRTIGKNIMKKCVLRKIKLNKRFPKYKI
jgi:hypothetical protein